MATYNEQLVDIQKQIDELQKKQKQLKEEQRKLREEKNSRFLYNLRKNRDIVLSLFPDHDFEHSTRDGWYYNGERIVVDDNLEALRNILDDEWEDRFEVSFDVYIRPIKEA